MQILRPRRRPMPVRRPTRPQYPRPYRVGRICLYPTRRLESAARFWSKRLTSDWNSAGFAELTRLILPVISLHGFGSTNTRGDTDTHTTTPPPTTLSFCGTWELLRRSYLLAFEFLSYGPANIPSIQYFELGESRSGFRNGIRLSVRMFGYLDGFDLIIDGRIEVR